MPSNRRKRTKSPLLLLDSFSAKDLATWEAQKEKILRYHWDLYSALAYERHKISEQITLSLLEIAEGQEAGQLNKLSEGLSPLDLALIKKDSISIVSVEGHLETIIDLNQPAKLKPFLNLIKGFAIPKMIVQTAEKLGLKTPATVQNIKTLIASLLEPNWRAMPMQFDIPANCQIFGQLVANAGIGGILYPSKFSNKKCLAIYPQNFDSESFVAVEDEVPQNAISRIDANMWPSIKATF